MKRPDLQVDLLMLAADLREFGKALEGDGFGYVGTLKSACKKTCKQLEEMSDLIEKAPNEPVVLTEQNPRCLGRGADNLPTCACRAIFESWKAKL